MALKERGTRNPKKPSGSTTRGTKPAAKTPAKVAAKTPQKATALRPVVKVTPIPRSALPKHRPRVVSTRVRFMTFVMAVPLLLLWINYAQRGSRLTPPPIPVVETLRGRILTRDGMVLAESSKAKRNAPEERHYPQGSLAGQLLGFNGVDRGLEGLEFFFEDRMKGGQDITITLDPVMQAAAEAGLERTIRENNAEAGSVVALEAKTGRILAVANYPSFNPSLWDNYKKEARTNRAFRNMYEPGSTVKALVAALLLNEGVVTPESRFEVPMSRVIEKHVINDPIQHGPVLGLADMLRYSSNVGISTLAGRISEPSLYRYLSAKEGFGFGKAVQPSGVSDAKGLLRPWEQWYPVDRATLSFGQGLSTTTLGLASAFSVLVNDGLFVQPRLIEGESGSAPRRVVSVSSARTVRQMLQQAVELGTPNTAVIPGYCVGGKTGTAQVAINGKYATDVYSSLFAGFFPVDQPKVTMVVEVYNAKKQHHGSQVAAPAFRDIAEEVLAHWGATPNTSGSCGR